MDKWAAGDWENIGMPCAAGVIFFFQRLKKKVTTGIDRQEEREDKRGGLLQMIGREGKRKQVKGEEG